jgi:S1-C subfamily serine protease
VRVRTEDGRELDAELAGWDAATSLAVLKVDGLAVKPLAAATAVPRVGHVAIALARSWSNAITASAGIVAVIGGPLRTGRRRSIEQVIRTTAPLHDGFAGGPLLDASGGVIGISTASAIRGFQVAIPASIAWATVASVLQHGRPGRGFLGIAGQTVTLAGSQGAEPALLIVGVTADSPAAAAGLLVGDVMLRFDGQPVRSAEDLLELLAGERVGRGVPVDILRGGEPRTVTITVAERRVG